MKIVNIFINEIQGHFELDFHRKMRLIEEGKENIIFSTKISVFGISVLKQSAEESTIYQIIDFLNVILLTV